MAIQYECPDAPARIEALALAVAGLEAPPEAAGALYTAAVGAAAGLCGRNDIPRAMEPALALILADLYREGLHRPVSAVKRGDTTITYAAGGEGRMADTRALLKPFVRLQTV